MYYLRFWPIKKNLKENGGVFCTREHRRGQFWLSIIMDVLNVKVRAGGTYARGGVVARKLKNVSRAIKTVYGSSSFFTTQRPPGGGGGGGDGTIIFCAGDERVRSVAATAVVGGRARTPTARDLPLHGGDGYRRTLLLRLRLVSEEKYITLLLLLLYIKFACIFHFTF